MTGTKDSVDVVISGYENVDDNGRVLSLFPESDEEFEEERFVERNGMIWNRLFRRSALLEKGILFPEHRLMEDTVFCLRCAPLRSRTQVVPVREYCYYSSNSASITHSKKNRMLSQEQLPFAELEQIIESGEYKRTIYYENTLLNAMMEVCCWLSTYSAAEVQQYAAEEAGKMFRRLNLSGEELSQILRAGDNSAFGRLLLRGYWFAAKHHKEQGFARLANRIIRLLRGQ